MDLSWATSSRMGKSCMLWHLWVLFIQLITSIESTKFCRLCNPFSLAKMRSIYNAKSSALLFVHDPSPHFNRKKWSSSRYKTTLAPQQMASPCASPSKYPQGNDLSIVSSRISLKHGVFCADKKEEATTNMLVSTTYGVVT